MPGRSAVDEAIAAVGFGDATGGAQCGDALVERGGADSGLGSQLGERDRLTGIGEDGQDAIIERAWLRCHGLAAVGDLQREGVAALG